VSATHIIKFAQTHTANDARVDLQVTSTQSHVSYMSVTPTAEDARVQRAVEVLLIQLPHEVDAIHELILFPQPLHASGLVDNANHDK